MIFSKSLLAVSALSVQAAVGAPVEQAERDNGLAFQKAVSEAFAHDLRKRGFWKDFADEFKEKDEDPLCSAAVLQGKGAVGTSSGDGRCFNYSHICQNFQVGDECSFIWEDFGLSSFYELFEDDFTDLQNAIGKQSHRSRLDWTTEGIWTATWPTWPISIDELPASILQHYFYAITESLPNNADNRKFGRLTWHWSKDGQSNTMVVQRRSMRK